MTVPGNQVKILNSSAAVNRELVFIMPLEEDNKNLYIAVIVTAR